MDPVELDREHRTWMLRCLDLAALGGERVAPNPMVGAVLVRQGELLAEGWHSYHGGPHAEVECLNAYGDGPIPEDATLYVNLEPCAHHGKTPPCAELLIHRGVKQVVVGELDPFPAVSGKGISMLRAAGIDVTVGVQEEACAWQQRRFLTSVRAGRPYVTLKWARSQDGFLDQHPRTERAVQRISSPVTDVMVHRWRSAEQAIVVGSRTIVNDDPALTVRHVEGRQPLRIVIDRQGLVPASSKVFTSSEPTLVLTNVQRADIEVEQVILPKDGDPIEQLFQLAHARSIRSLLVEGGAELLGHFLQSGRWDEARVITGEAFFQQGTPAPLIPQKANISIHSSADRIELFVNPKSAVVGTIRIEPSWRW